MNLLRVQLHDIREIIEGQGVHHPLAIPEQLYSRELDLRLLRKHSLRIGDIVTHIARYLLHLPVWHRDQDPEPLTPQGLLDPVKRTHAALVVLRREGTFRLSLGL